MPDATPRRGTADLPDLALLVGGDKQAWDSFVGRTAGLIHAAVWRVIAGKGGRLDDALDIAQSVFLRLCANHYRLLRTYDPGRAALTTWLHVIATTSAIDWVRRRRPAENIDDVAPAAFAVPPPAHERLVIPPDLLTDRQKEVLALLYDHDLDATEVAERLAIEPQTVRSTHHKAIVRLRTWFQQRDDT
ncbi:MAG: sigma-70 family RNA polymerase sigma factor [Alphaproteobacteria bacterium]